MTIQQFVVVGAGRLDCCGGTHQEVRIRHFGGIGFGIVGDVIQEGMTSAQGPFGAHWRGAVALQGGAIQQN